MKSMAVRGTIIMLAAVALIGAVVVLRVAQAQQTNPTYTLSVSPDKVLEGGSVDVTVEVTVDPAPSSAQSVYLHIANETDGDGCNIISTNCPDDANMDNDSNAVDLDLNRFITRNSATFEFTDTASVWTLERTLSPKQDVEVEGDEKIYLALCDVMVDSNNECTGGTLLATASITIVGERVYVDNTNNTATTTNLDHPSDTATAKIQVAGAFTTGSAIDGYRLNNVKLKFGGDTSNTDDTPTGVTVGLYEGSGAQPSNRIEYLCLLKDSISQDCSQPDSSITAGQSHLKEVLYGV